MGSYPWHQLLAGSDCILSRGIAGFLNSLSSAFGRKTRFYLYLEEQAKIDFAVMEPSVEYELAIYTVVNEEWDGLIGLGFAGSNMSSFFCKAEHIKDAG